MPHPDAKLIAACEKLHDIEEEFHLYDHNDEISDADLEAYYTRLGRRAASIERKIRRMQVRTLEGARALAFQALRFSPDVLTEEAGGDRWIHLLLVKLTAPEELCTPI